MRQRCRCFSLSHGHDGGWLQYSDARIIPRLKIPENIRHSFSLGEGKTRLASHLSSIHSPFRYPLRSSHESDCRESQKIRRMMVVKGRICFVLFGEIFRPREKVLSVAHPRSAVRRSYNQRAQFTAIQVLNRVFKSTAIRDCVQITGIYIKHSRDVEAKEQYKHMHRGIIVVVGRDSGSQIRKYQFA